MARQISVNGNVGNERNCDAIIRLCRRATEIDPNYARAWALMAVSQANLRLHIGRQGESGLAAAEQAIALVGNLAEAHAARRAGVRSMPIAMSLCAKGKRHFGWIQSHTKRTMRRLVCTMQCSVQGTQFVSGKKRQS